MALGRLPARTARRPVDYSSRRQPFSIAREKPSRAIKASHWLLQARRESCDGCTQSRLFCRQRFGSPAPRMVRRRHRANLPSWRDVPPIQQRHYAEAIHLLEDGLKRFPADRTLKIELGRAYLYNRQDDRAMHLFREVLREEPSNRVAKLELARTLGYQRDYEASNVLYRGPARRWSG